MRLRALPAAAASAPADPAGLLRRDWHIGHPTAQSQQAGLDHLMRIAMEQAAGPSAGARGPQTRPAEWIRRTGPNVAADGDDPRGAGPIPAH
jgi:hypothetical protein